MVKSLTDVNVLFNASVPLNINPEVCMQLNTKYKGKRFKNPVEYNRFRSRKPPKNPREVVPKASQKNNCKVYELQKIQSKIKKSLPITKTEQTKREFQKNQSSAFHLNSNYIPPFLSKSQFAFTKRRSGSNFSLTVNLSKSKIRHPRSLKKKVYSSLGNSQQQNFKHQNLKHSFLIVPLISANNYGNLAHIYPFIMEKWESDVRPQSQTFSTKKCFCIESHDQQKKVSTVNQSPRSGGAIERSSCFGDRYPDMYRQFLGPTPDETILAGLQTVIDMCATVESKPKSLRHTSSNQDIIKWVENEYSTLEQDCKINPCQTSLHNIQKRKKTLQEIEKLVKRKSELDEEALTIKKNTESVTSKTSTSKSDNCESMTTEDESDREQETTVPCTAIQSKIRLCDSAKLKKCQCTQTVTFQKCKATQQPSSTTCTKTTSAKPSDDTDSDDLSTKTTQTTASEESTSDICSKTDNTGTSSKSCKCSSTEESATQSTNESIHCSNKSTQVCTPIPLSTKCVQTCISLKHLDSVVIKPCPASLTNTYYGKSACENTKSKVVKVVKLQCNSEKCSEPSGLPQNLPPASTKSLRDEVCNCKCIPSLQNSEQTVLSTNTLNSKTTSNSSNETSETTTESSKVSSSNCNCQCQQSTKTGPDLISRNTVSTVDDRNNTLEENTKPKEKEKLICQECMQSPKCEIAVEKMVLCDKEIGAEKSLCAVKLNDSESQKQVANCLQKTSCSKQFLKSPRKSSTLEPVLEESSSKLSLCNLCQTKSSTVKLPATCASEGSYHCSKLSSRHPCETTSLPRQHRLIPCGRCKDKQIEKFSLKTELSKKVQTMGDCFTKTTSKEVRYATVRITKFEQYSTFEILNACIRKPKRFPATIETIFVVKNKSK